MGNPVRVRCKAHLLGSARDKQLISSRPSSVKSFARSAVSKPTCNLLKALYLIAISNGLVQCDLATRPTESSRPLVPLDGSDANQSLRVAILAERLQHWRDCRRLMETSQATSESTGNVVVSGCDAHFDGHLCWPATKAGQGLELECPLTRPLLSLADASSVSGRSVINPIQSERLSTTVYIENNNNSISDDHQSSNRPTLTDIQPPLVAGSSPEIGRSLSEGVARRMCQLAPEVAPPHLVSNGSHRTANWQPQADYSACQARDQWINLSPSFDEQLFGNLGELLESASSASRLDPYGGEPEILHQWILCIYNIMRQHESSSMEANGPGHQEAGSGWCPVTFDGLLCWPATRAGRVAFGSCPASQAGFRPDRLGEKVCTEDGTWFRSPESNRSWTNYFTCLDHESYTYHTMMSRINVLGNLISLVALSVSLIIFTSFKSLNCTRVAIHRNLFLSFVTNNLMWVIWYKYVVTDASLLESNPIECRLWHILLHYFLVANYFWMFCEGLYLHTLLVVAFVSDDKILKWFYLLGWLAPVPIISAYAYQRNQADPAYTKFCWMDESPHNLILTVPIGISLLLNLVFLINIVRVLVTKLRANNSPDTHQTRKAVRATLILIPLLGLHYMLTPFRPEEGNNFLYGAVAAICSSFQGLCVAMLFCFCNAEVIAAVKKKLKDTFNLSHISIYNDLRRPRSSTLATTCALSNANTPITTTNSNPPNTSAVSENKVDGNSSRPSANQLPGAQMGTAGRLSNCSSLLTNLTCNSSSSPAQSVATTTLLSSSHESGPVLQSNNTIAASSYLSQHHSATVVNPCTSQGGLIQSVKEHPELLPQNGSSRVAGVPSITTTSFSVFT